MPVTGSKLVSISMLKKAGIAGIFFVSPGRFILQVITRTSSFACTCSALVEFAGESFSFNDQAAASKPLEIGGMELE